MTELSGAILDGASRPEGQGTGTVPCKSKMRLPWAAGFVLAVLFGASVASAAEIELRNVSYDPTREFYVEYNTTFAKYWKAKTGQDVVVKQSHG